MRGERTDCCGLLERDVMLEVVMAGEMAPYARRARAAGGYSNDADESYPETPDEVAVDVDDGMEVRSLGPETMTQSSSTLVFATRTPPLLARNPHVAELSRSLRTEVALFTCLRQMWTNDLRVGCLGLEVNGGSSVEPSIKGGQAILSPLKS